MPKTRKDTAASTHKNTCRRRDSYPRPHDYMAKHDTTELQISQSTHTSFISQRNNLKNEVFLPFNVYNTRKTRKDTAPSTHKNTGRRRDSYPRPHDYIAKHDTTELDY